MKRFIIALSCVVFIGGLSGCGKTLNELRTNADSVVDNGEQAVVTGTGIISGLIKKAIGIVNAVYTVGTKVVEDSKDNVNSVTGAVNTSK